MYVWQVEPVSPLMVPSPGVAAFIGFSAQGKLVQFESAGASTLNTFPFDFYPGRKFDRSLIGSHLLDQFLVQVLNLLHHIIFLWSEALI